MLYFLKTSEASCIILAEVPFSLNMVEDYVVLCLFWAVADFFAFWN